ncbi:MAG: ABC transporter permease [Actinomycetota bacterium]|nr:ABC transporter permease [Actinomycetota bacterium]
MVLARHLYMRMMRRGRVIGLTALASVPGLVYWLSAFDARDGQEAELYSDIVTTAGFSFTIAALILTVATLREERESGTLPYIYMRPIPRLSLAASAMAAGTGAALTVALGGWLSTLIAALAVGAEPSLAISGLALFVAAAVGYAAVFVPLGYLVPRAILVGLGYIIVIESILAAAVTGFAQFSIWRISVSIYADLTDEFGTAAQDMLGPVTAGVGGGVIKLVAVFAVGLGVLTWALRRRDAL